MPAATSAAMRAGQQRHVVLSGMLHSSRRDETTAVCATRAIVSLNTVGIGCSQVADVPTAAVLAPIGSDGVASPNSRCFCTFFSFFRAVAAVLAEALAVAAHHAVVLHQDSPTAAGSVKCSSLRTRLTVAREMAKVFAICVSDCP